MGMPISLTVWRESENMADSGKPSVRGVLKVVVSQEDINGASRSSHVL